MKKREAFFSKQLRKIMFDKNITQQKLAKELGIAQTDISRWLGGHRNPSLKSIEKIADYFSVPLNYFIENFKDTKNKDISEEKQNEKLIKIGEELLKLGKELLKEIKQIKKKK